jgi:HK97 family phage portal protein
VISRDKFANPTDVHYVKHSDVTPVIVEGMAYYRIRSTVYEYSDVMHLRDLWKDDLKGVSKITQHAYTLGKIQSVNEMQNKNYTNGMIIGGVVEYPMDVEMDPAQIDQVEAIFKKKYTSGKPEIAFLGGGGKFSQFKPSMSFTDAAIIADIGLTKVDICSIFTVPPPKIGILGDSNYSSVKQLQIDFQTGAVLPIVRLMEEQLKKMLKQSEQATHYIKKEIDSMLRADPIESVALIAQAIASGLLSVNEGREILDRNPVEGGDKYYIPTNNLSPINEDINK